MFESYWLSDSYIQVNTQKLDHTPRSQAMLEELGSGLRTRLQQYKAGELVASFPGHVGGARKWPENEATAVKLVNL